MPTAQDGHATIDIAAPPDVVYDLIADVSRMGEWSPECYRCEWLDGATAAVHGARFRGYNRRGGLRWERTAVIEVADRGREFGFTTVNDGTGRQETRWRYSMQPSDSGTILTESFQFLWCSLGNRAVELFIPRGRQVNSGIDETLRRIKHAAERDLGQSEIRSGMPELTRVQSHIAAELEDARADFRRLLSLVDDDEWNKPTSGTRWTNEELLFHMVFGYMVVQRLLILVRLFGRLPEFVSRGFARMLNTATPLFDVINFYGSRLAATVYNRKRMAVKFDRVLDALERSLARESHDALRRGMYFPTRWDPYFRDYMTLADVYRYPWQHYDHHRRQLTLANLA